MNLSNKHTFDVAIIGSGIAGSTLGAILARQGVSVVMFEATSHPKFAIGESMILETSETLRAMAEFYDVPELAFFSSENYFAHIGTSHGVKRHFSYLHHDKYQFPNAEKTLQAVIPKQPYGHELHLHRQDSDYFLMTVAIRYGVTVMQKTAVKQVKCQTDGVQIETTQDQTFIANYVVDAGGFCSILAQQFQLRHDNLQTHSRALFTHMVDVPCYHKVADSKDAYGVPFPFSEGTLHHLFEGGWLWVIPFDNHKKSTNPLCSVGLMLDPRVHPCRDTISPEAEFYALIKSFPGICGQFRTAKSVRPWVRTGRLQYASKQVVGDRFCLLGHAAGFIDPLFSKGLYSSLHAVSVLANLLLQAKATDNYTRKHFQPLEDITLGFIQANDRLIANAYKSFGNDKLWSMYAVLWLLGAYSELVKLTSIRAQTNNRTDYYQQLQSLKLVGGSFSEFDQLSQQIYTLVEQTDMTSTWQVHQTISKMKACFEQVTWMPTAFRDIVQGKNHLPAQKIRPDIFQRSGGFLGEGAYRTHFFGKQSLGAIASFFLREKTKYSLPVIALQRKGAKGCTSHDMMHCHR